MGGNHARRAYEEQPSRPYGARREGNISFACLRGGSVTGDHSVVSAGPHERLILSHYAEDRSLFVSGALRAGRLFPQRPEIDE
jgi:4-hydroxy-tetrahydrodipicolinate reductase